MKDGYNHYHIIFSSSCNCIFGTLVVICIFLVLTNLGGDILPNKVVVHTMYLLLHSHICMYERAPVVGVVILHRLCPMGTCLYRVNYVT